MEVKKLFALASVTALTGFVSAGITAGCSSTEVVTIPNDSGLGGTSGTVKPTTEAGPKKGTSSSGSSNGQPSDDDDSSSGDDDDMAMPTCLDKTPIDQTMYPYEKAIPAQKAVCSAKELSDLSAYYKAHGAEDDFTVTTWKGSVSDKCATCVFTDTTDDAPAKSWAPLVVKDDQVDTVNRGGCVEALSGKESCGRAYQQYVDCTVDACAKSCKTQTDYTACRGDAAVLTTSCKGAIDALKTECGEKNIAGYETGCKGTTYTFEGPIKVMCVNGAPGVKDASTPITDAKSDG